MTTAKPMPTQEECGGPDDSVYLERLRSKIVVDENGCHVFTGHLNIQGYGSFWYRATPQRPHRVILHLTGVELNLTKVVNHICRNTSCINTDHLEQITHKENVLHEESLSPAKANADKTHCYKGHEFTEENTRMVKKGHKLKRKCRECSSTYEKGHYLRNKAVYCERAKRRYYRLKREKNEVQD